MIVHGDDAMLSRGYPGGTEVEARDVAFPAGGNQNRINGECLARKQTQCDTARCPRAAVAHLFLPMKNNPVALHRAG